MRDMILWQAFEKEDGTIDADKGSVLTVWSLKFPEPQVHSFDRKETAKLLTLVATGVTLLSESS